MAIEIKEICHTEIHCDLRSCRFREQNGVCNIGFINVKECPHFQMCYKFSPHNSEERRKFESIMNCKLREAMNKDIRY